MTGKIVEITRALSGRFHLTLELNEDDKVKKVYDQLHDKQLIDIDIKNHKKKRSLDANNYSWHLITEIANVLRVSKDEMYEYLIVKHGQPLYNEDGSRSQLFLPYGSDPRIYNLHLKNIGTEYDLNTALTHYEVYRGQSDYDTREMAVFIDGLVDEAKELGIETLTYDELERMKAAWKA